MARWVNDGRHLSLRHEPIAGMKRALVQLG
jgi:hypothetical protein